MVRGDLPGEESLKVSPVPQVGKKAFETPEVDGVLGESAAPADTHRYGESGLALEPVGAIQLPEDIDERGALQQEANGRDPPGQDS